MLMVRSKKVAAGRREVKVSFHIIEPYHKYLDINSTMYLPRYARLDCGAWLRLI